MAARYQRGNHNPSTEGQTIQWLQDTKGVITSRLRKDRQYNGYKIQRDNHTQSTEGQTIQWLQDTKGVITTRLLKDRQYNGYKIPEG
jgi:hypothetical protein